MLQWSLLLVYFSSVWLLLAAPCANKRIHVSSLLRYWLTVMTTFKKYNRHYYLTLTSKSYYLTDCYSTLTVYDTNLYREADRVRICRALRDDSTRRMTHSKWCHHRGQSPIARNCVPRACTTPMASRRVARIFVRGDTTMEGPKVWSGEGRRAKIFEKSTLKLHIFFWF